MHNFMLNDKKKWGDIVFISPRDIKKGEKFSLIDLFSIEDNLKEFNSFGNNIVSNEINIKIESEKNKLEKEKNEYNAKIREHFQAKIDLNEELLEKRTKSFEKENSEILKREKELFEKEKIIFTNELKNEIKLLENSNASFKERYEEYKNLLEDKKNSYESLKKQLWDVYEIKLEEERSKNNKRIEEIVKEYEDAKKSSTTIGKNAENEVKEKLKSFFKEDKIEDTNASIGEADILHKIINNGEEISSIYYEIKNRVNWSKANYENFANKVRTEKHDFNIFISSALPKRSREQHIKFFSEDFLYDEINNIYLTSFNNWIPIIASLRNQAIELSKIKDEKENKFSIQERIYQFFKSPEFKNYFARIMKNISESNKYFEDIQRTSIKGKGEIEKISFEIENLNMKIKSQFSNKE